MMPMEPLLSTYRSIAQGGWIMIPISFCSIASIALIVERAIALRSASLAPRGIVDSVRALIRERKVSEAQALCRATPSAAGRVLVSGLSVLDLDRNVVVDEFERAAKQESIRMEAGLTLLGTLAAGGPLLGLFGTVTGMIRTFSAIRTAGIGDPLQLSAGISEALLSTAGGMVVGIPALVFHRYFLRKIDENLAVIEDLCQDALLYLKDRA